MRIASVLRMKYQLEVLGTATLESCPSVILHFDSQSYLFNVGEGTQRSCTQNKIRLGKIQNIFLTRMHWDCIGGFLGMSLTLHDVVDQHIQVFGPSGLIEFINSTSSFIKNMNRSYVECDSNQQSLKQDENINLSTIVLSAAELKQDLGKRKGYDSAPCYNPTSISYLIRGPERKGKFDPRAAMQLGLKPGPLFKRLVAGETLILENGTQILPSQCMSPSTPGPAFLIVDCPSLAFVPDVITKLSKSTCLTDSEQMALIVHMIGSDVLHDPNYKAWMREFGDDTHHIIISPDLCNQEITFTSFHAIQEILSQLDSKVFKPGYYSHSPKLEITEGTFFETLNDKWKDYLKRQ